MLSKMMDKGLSENNFHSLIFSNRHNNEVQIRRTKAVLLFKLMEGLIPLFPCTSWVFPLLPNTVLVLPLLLNSFSYSCEWFLWKHSYHPGLWPHQLSQTKQGQAWSKHGQGKARCSTKVMLLICSFLWVSPNPSGLACSGAPSDICIVLSAMVYMKNIFQKQNLVICKVTVTYSASRGQTSSETDRAALNNSALLSQIIQWFQLAVASH